jgi:hypothetical protein
MPVISDSSEPEEEEIDELTFESETNANQMADTDDDEEEDYSVGIFGLISR